MKKILVIGSTGMLGSEITKLLIKKKMEFHSISTTNTNERNHHKIDVIELKQKKRQRL